MSNVQDLNDSGSNQEQNTQPSFVTKDELSSMLNSAITGHLKRLNVSKQITDALEQSLTPYKDLLTQATKQPADTDKATGNSGAERNTTGAAVANVSPEFVAMQKKLELMEKSIKEKEQMIAAKERAAKEKDAFAKVCSELTAFGVRAEGVDHLAKVLRADNKIKVDDDGSVSFVLDEENEVDLKEGLKKYLDPKVNPAVGLYLPPKTVNKNGKIVSNRGNSVDLSTIQDPAARALAQLSQMKK